MASSNLPYEILTDQFNHEYCTLFGEVFVELLLSLDEIEVKGKGKPLPTISLQDNPLEPEIYRLRKLIVDFLIY